MPNCFIGDHSHGKEKDCPVNLEINIILIGKRQYSIVPTTERCEIEWKRETHPKVNPLVSCVPFFVSYSIYGFQRQIILPGLLIIMKNIGRFHQEVGYNSLIKSGLAFMTHPWSIECIEMMLNDFCLDFLGHLLFRCSLKTQPSRCKKPSNAVAGHKTVQERALSGLPDNRQH